MNEQIQHHWNENIKPALAVMLLGALLVFGMRLAELVWPKTAAKVVICFANDVGKVNACKPFETVSN